MMRDVTGPYLEHGTQYHKLSVSRAYLILKNGLSSLWKVNIYIVISSTINKHR